MAIANLKVWLDQPLGPKALARCLWLRQMLLPPPARFLEVGMGHWQASEIASGDFDADTSDFHSDGWGNAGVDANLSFIEQARATRPHDSVHLCDVANSRLPFVDNLYHSVVCSETLEHIDKHRWPFALTECWRVAINQLLITVPFRRQTVNNPTQGKMRYSWDYHKWEPSPQDAEQLITCTLHPVLLVTKHIASFTCIQAVKKHWW